MRRVRGPRRRSDAGAEGTVSHLTHRHAAERYVCFQASLLKGASYGVDRDLFNCRRRGRDVPSRLDSSGPSDLKQTNDKRSSLGPRRV